MSLISPLRRPLVDPLGRPLSGGGLPWEGGGGAAPLIPLDALSPSLLLDERGISVSAWANQGSAGGTADQATGANQPALTSLNSVAALDFDGTDDHQLTSVIASSLVTAATLSGLVVVRVDSSSASAPSDLVWYNNPGIIAGSASSGFGVAFNRDGARFGRGNTPYSASFTVPLLADGGTHVVRFRLSGGDMAISLDGGPWRTTAGVNNLNPLTAGVRIGANYNAAQRFPGVIGTVMLKGAALSDAQWAGALRYVAAKYAIDATPRVDFMWVGDSITSHTLGTMSAWRQRVQSVAGGFYRATGRQIGTGWVQDYGFAGGGQTCAALAATLAANALSTTYRADVCPILLGTNDIAVDGVTNAVLATRYGAMLDDLETRMPGALYVCQKLMPRGDGFNAQVTDWNNNYHATAVADAVTRGINAISDDTFATLAGVSYIDAVHPAAASTNLMGDAIAAKLATWAALA